MARSRGLMIGFVLAAFTIGAVADDKKPSLDPDKLVGEWKLTAGTKNGDKIDNISGDVKFTKDKITMKGENDMVFEFAYTIDGKSDPAAIDMEILAPESFKGGKALGIVALDGETFKLAYNPFVRERPKDFEAKKDSGEFSFELKKAENK